MNKMLSLILCCVMLIFLSACQSGPSSMQAAAEPRSSRAETGQDMLENARYLDAPLDGSGLDSAEDYLAAIEDNEALKVEWDREKQEDQEWRTLYFTQTNLYYIRMIKLIGDFAAEYPDAPELEDLLLDRFQYATYMRSIDLRKEVEAYTRRYAGADEKAASAWYWYAFNSIRLNYRKEEPIVAAIKTFESRYPGDDRLVKLYELGINYLKDQPGEKKLREILIEKFPDSSAAQKAQQKAVQEEAVGKPFELEFTDQLTGRRISIRDLRGKVVVIDFWATWCGPCVSEIPHMRELYETYKSKGVEFIGISLDNDPQVLKDFCKKAGISWPQYCEPGKAWDTAVSREWGITGIPTIFILDKEGKIFSTTARGRLDQLIPGLLKG